MPNESTKTRRYGEAMDLLARVCLSQYPESDSNDVADAVGHAIGRSMPTTINAVAMAIDVMDEQLALAQSLECPAP